MLLQYLGNEYKLPTRNSEEPKNNLPLVNEGDALFHIAGFERIELVESQLEEFMNLEPGFRDIYRVSEPKSGSEKP